MFLLSKKSLTAFAIALFMSTLGAADTGLPSVEATQNPMAFLFTSPNDANAQAWLWSFGDGNTSIVESPTHTYAYPGRYVVTLNITSDGQEKVHQVGVVEAGHIALFQDFESQPPTGWTYDPQALTEDAIGGSKSWYVDIISPATNDSCVPPSHIPKDPPNKWAPMLDSSFYEGLIDLRDASLAEGSMLTFFWMDDPASDAVITEARIRRFQGQTQIGLVASDVRGLHQQWTTLTGLNDLMFRVEIHPWKAFPEEPDGGGARLRFLDPTTSVQLGLIELTGLRNQDAVWTTPVFGISRTEFPKGSGGVMRLDDLAVRLYDCLPPSTTDLLGHWSFDDPVNLGKDQSSFERHATPVGGAGGSSGALLLDGTGYLTIPGLGTGLVDRKHLSVEGWVRVESHTENNAFRARQPVALHSDRFGVTNYVDGNGWENVVASPAPPVGEWYHLAGVWNEGNLRIYVDGVLRGERILPFAETQGTWYTDWAIGARTPGAGAAADQFFSGGLDELKIYGRALSEAEIRAAAEVCHP